MAETKKKVPKDLKLAVGGKSNYESSTIKGKGTSKKQDIKSAIKNEGGLGGKKKSKASK